MRELPWTSFKAFVSARNLSIQYVDVDDHYLMWAYDGPMSFECKLYKSASATTDKLDFENNFKSLGNDSFSDADGIEMNRLKIAKAGAKFCFHGIEFSTSTLNSVIETKADGTSF